MNFYFPRFVKLFYRREPISSFILIAAAVDMVLGGVDGRLSLFSVGLLMAMLAFLIRWKQGNSRNPLPSRQPPRRYLPPSPDGDRQPLPLLTKQRHQGPY